jgi:L-iditol 2-dehydrogenase
MLLSCKSDLDQGRLDFAKKMGADAVIKVTSRDPKVTAQEVEAALGELADITIECSGAPPSINAAIYVCFPILHVFLLLY